MSIAPRSQDWIGGEPRSIAAAGMLSRRGAMCALSSPPMIDRGVQNLGVEIRPRGAGKLLVDSRAHGSLAPAPLPLVLIAVLDAASPPRPLHLRQIPKPGLWQGGGLRLPGMDFLLAGRGIDRLAAMSFIVLPLPPRRAAVAGSRAYRKWRGAAPLRGR